MDDLESVNEKFEIGALGSREAVFEAASHYYRKSQQTSFVPGVSYIPATTKSLNESDLLALIDASLDLWLTAGRFSNEFESALPKYFGNTTRALLVNSGSSANLLSLSSLGSPMLARYGYEPMERGDEVVTVAAGFPTTVNPIVQNGWIPVFVDIEKETLNANLELIKAACTPRTRAIMLAHTLGNPFRSDQLAAFCKEMNLFLIEDCCDAFGSTIQTDSSAVPTPVGSFGDYATVSFYPAHHITTGEGGAVFSRDGSLRRVAESMRNWGRDCWCETGQDNTCKKQFDWQLGDLPPGYDHKYTYSSVGYNLKMTDMQAAIGLSQLARVGNFIERRRSNWKALVSGIESSPVLSRGFTPIRATPGTNPSWFGLPLHCAENISRQKIVRALEERKIGTRLIFAGNLTKQPAYKGVNFKVCGDLTNTDYVMNKTFWIGVHPQVGAPQIQYMLEQLEEVVK